jgi:hypothetical protein
MGQGRIELKLDLIFRNAVSTVEFVPQRYFVILKDLHRKVFIDLFEELGLRAGGDIERRTEFVSRCFGLLGSRGYGFELFGIWSNKLVLGVNILSSRVIEV